MALGTICRVSSRLSIDSTFNHLNHLGAIARQRQQCFAVFAQSFATEAKRMSLPRVFFDMTADGKTVGRIVMEVKLFLLKFKFFYSEKLQVCC